MTQSGALTVGNTATFATAKTANVVLTEATNAFNTVAVTQAKDVTLTDADAIVLGKSSIGNDLTVTASGNVTQSGALTVGNTATFATAKTANVVLTEATNAFNTVAVTQAKDVTLTDADAIVLGKSSIGNDLTVTASGNVTQSGALTVGNTATIATAKTAKVELTNAGNDFTTVVVTKAQDVSLTDKSAIVLGKSSIGNDLTVTAGGAITDSGALSVAKTATFSATGSDITLDKAHNFATVVISAGSNVTLNDTNAIVLGKSSIGNDLTVTASGNVTQSGALTVGNTATFATAKTAKVELTNAGNDFTTVMVTKHRTCH